jgi:hypothetical protein
MAEFTTCLMHCQRPATTCGRSENLGVMLISETHFSGKSHLKLSNCTAYSANHSAGTALVGTAIIIQNCIKHHHLNSYSQDFLQATSVSVEFRMLIFHQDAQQNKNNWKIFIIPQDDGSLQVGTTVDSIPTVGPDLFHSKDANYSKRWKAGTWNTYLRGNPDTGHLTGINYRI